MTDKEIFETEIKCIKRRSSGQCNGGTDCGNCDLLMDEQDIISAYERAIDNVDLINLQQAEIERLQNDLAISRKETKRYATRKSEAIKEFAERYKAEVTKRYEDIAYKDLFFRVIDNLVKEMNKPSLLDKKFGGEQE